MNKVMSATEARVHFGELMQHVVENAAPVIVERAGKPQVVVALWDFIFPETACRQSIERIQFSGKLAAYLWAFT